MCTLLSTLFLPEFHQSPLRTRLLTMLLFLILLSSQTQRPLEKLAAVLRSLHSENLWIRPCSRKRFQFNALTVPAPEYISLFPSSTWKGFLPWRLTQIRMRPERGAAPASCTVALAVGVFPEVQEQNHFKAAKYRAESFNKRNAASGGGREQNRWL